MREKKNKAELVLKGLQAVRKKTLNDCGIVKDDKKPKLRSSEKFRENPFREKLIQELVIRHQKKQVCVDGDNSTSQIVINGEGDVTGHASFYQIRRVDPAQFTKIFISRVAGIWDMPRPATRVFSYILNVLPKQKDEIFIDYEKALEFTEYSSHNSINNGLKWLIENEFVAKSIKPLHYFINPNIFFNGDRVAFVDFIAKNSVPKSELEFKEEEDSQQ